TSWQWTFEGGSPSSSTAQNPVVTYQAAGVYGVTLTVSNAAGSSTVEYPDYITVGDVPEVAIASVSVNGATASFSAAVANADSLWWDFGDGTTSTESDPQHTYVADDAYTVVLTAVNGCGTSTADTLVVIATQAPVAAFTSDVQEGCPALVVQFENLSSANAQWFEWSFPGGEPTTSSDPNPVVTYGQPGTYDVVLVAGNAVGSDTFALSDYIVVHALPEAGFATTVNDTTATVTFEDLSQAAESWFWDFGDGTTSTEASPVHAYGQVGTFTVMQVVSNACGTDTLWQDVLIAGVQPVALFSADVTFGCAPLTVHFTDLSTGNVTGWHWSFPGGTPSTSADPNPVVTY
ncbi:MAG: PKD domain-containing protein, partial [Bacteroidetes bacterium]